jgi:hypothetical protein
MLKKGRQENAAEIQRLEDEIADLVQPGTPEQEWPEEARARQRELNVLLESLEKSPPFPKARGMIDYIEQDPQWKEWTAWRIEQKRNYLEAALSFIRGNDPDHIVLAGCETVPMGQEANGYLLETGGADYHWLAGNPDIAGLSFRWTVNSHSLEFKGETDSPDYKLPLSVRMAHEHGKLSVVSVGFDRAPPPSSEKISSFLSYLRSLGAAVVVRDGLTSPGVARLNRAEMKGILYSPIFCLPEPPRVPQPPQVRVLDCPATAGSYYQENSDRLVEALKGLRLLFDGGVTSALEPVCSGSSDATGGSIPGEEGPPLVVPEPGMWALLGLDKTSPIEGDAVETGQSESTISKVIFMNPSAGQEYVQGTGRGVPNPLLVKGLKDRLREETDARLNEYPGNDLVLSATWPYFYVYPRLDHDSTEDGHAVKFLVKGMPLPDRQIHISEKGDRVGGYVLLNVDTGNEIRCAVKDDYLIIDSVRFSKGKACLFYVLPDNSSSEVMKPLWHARQERLKHFATQQTSLLVVVLGLSVLMLILFLTFVLKRNELRKTRVRQESGSIRGDRGASK